jgi:uncharacterized protein (TIGR02678 family)
VPFTRRRYVLLCLALAALERGEAQIALGLAEQVVMDAGDPHLEAAGIAFTLERRDERLDLAAVVRLLLRRPLLSGSARTRPSSPPPPTRTAPPAHRWSASRASLPPPP